MSLVRSVLNAGVKAADAAAAWTEMAVSDFVHLGRTLDGNDVDAWDPEYVRRRAAGAGRAQRRGDGHRDHCRESRGSHKPFGQPPQIRAVGRTRTALSAHHKADSCRRDPDQQQWKAEQGWS